MASSARSTGRLTGKVCLVIGATSGIGEATVKAFSDEGAHVVFTGRRRELGEAMAACTPRCTFLCGDVLDAAHRQHVVDASIQLHGRLDVLVCCAGIVLSGSCLSTTEADWDATMNLNVKSVWLMCQAALRVMTRGSSIVIIASDWALVGAADALAYCVSKAAVLQLCRCIALEHARAGVRVNAVCAGDTFVARWTSEGYFSGSGPVPDDASTRSSESIPMGRVAEASEIARAVAFLASDDSSYMTGSAMVVDGGNTAR